VLTVLTATASLSRPAVERRSTPPRPRAVRSCHAHTCTHITRTRRRRSAGRGGVTTQRRRRTRLFDCCVRIERTRTHLRTATQAHTHTNPRPRLHTHITHPRRHAQSATRQSVRRLLVTGRASQRAATIKPLYTNVSASTHTRTHCVPHHQKATFAQTISIALQRCSVQHLKASNPLQCRWSVLCTTSQSTLRPIEKTL
jgi:hypothetical protein